MSPRASLDAVEKEKSPYPIAGIEPRSYNPYPNLYSNRGVPAPKCSKNE